MVSSEHNGPTEGNIKYFWDISIPDARWEAKPDPHRRIWELRVAKNSPKFRTRPLALPTVPNNPENDSGRLQGLYGGKMNEIFMFWTFRMPPQLEYTKEDRTEISKKHRQAPKIPNPVSGTSKGSQPPDKRLWAATGAAVHHPYATLMKSIGCHFNGDSTGSENNLILIRRPICAAMAMGDGNGMFLARFGELNSKWGVFFVVRI